MPTVAKGEHGCPQIPEDPLTNQQKVDYLPTLASYLVKTHYCG